MSTEKVFGASYSGSDITVWAVVSSDSLTTMPSENTNAVQLAELQTISYSIYRDKQEVRGLGNASHLGVTRGMETIAGTMIFTVFDDAVLSQLMRSHYGEGQRSLRIDQLPPLDLFVYLENETGQASKMSIFGVEFMNEGQVMSAQDLITENSVNYIAKHISRLRPIGSQIDDAFVTLRKSTVLNSYQEAQDEIAELKKYIL